MSKKQNKKITKEQLSIKSNTSLYAIENLENGTRIEAYTAARLVYFLMTSRDIDQTAYGSDPEGLFVDIIMGKSFGGVNFNEIVKNYSKIKKNKIVDNPKACGLPIYLKKE